MAMQIALTSSEVMFRKGGEGGWDMAEICATSHSWSWLGHGWAFMGPHKQAPDETRVIDSACKTSFHDLLLPQRGVRRWWWWGFARSLESALRSEELDDMHEKTPK